MVTDAARPGNPRLPGLLAEIASVAGLEAALKIAERHGGTRKGIPSHLPDGPHWLSECVGSEAAEKICAFFRQGSTGNRLRGAYVSIPRGPASTLAQARRKLEQALAEGASAAEAARQAGMTERAAHRARARLRQQRKQS
jgi:hypothetical protein